MVRCDDFETAREIATELSRRLLDDAPGLRLACVHEEWPVGQAFDGVWRCATLALEAAKAGSVPDAAFDGAGVAAACWSTGEPAVSWDDAETHWLGPAAKARLDASPDARQRIEEIHPLGEFSDADGRPRQLTWAHDLDKLGRTTGERSFVGVIHFDGNAMGARFRSAAQKDQDRVASALAELLRVGPPHQLFVATHSVLMKEIAPASDDWFLVRMQDGATRIERQSSREKLRARFASPEPVASDRRLVLLPGRVVRLTDELVAHLGAQAGELLFALREDDGSVRLLSEATMDKRLDTRDEAGE